MSLTELLLSVDNNEYSHKTREVVKIERLKELFGEDANVVCESISSEQYWEIQRRGILVKNAKKGQMDVSPSVIKNGLALAGVVDPDLKDKKLMEHFGCDTPQQLLGKIFKPGEISMLADVITRLTGFDEDDAAEDEDEVKN